MSILLASGRATFKALEKMRKNNAKHGIASASTKSKLAYYLRLEGYFSGEFWKLSKKWIKNT